jgi:AcrR family transcriptional regulator
MATSRARTSRRSTDKKSSSGAGRQELIDAAMHEFAHLGYAGASTVSIARRARVTQPLVYHHFGSKEGLWLAVIDQLFGELRRELERAATAQAGAPRRLRVQELLRALARFSGHHPLMARLVRTEGGGGRAFNRLYQRWLASLVQLFRDEITAAEKEGTVRPLEPALLYFIIVGACVEPFAQPELARRAFDLDIQDPAQVERYASTLSDVLLLGMLQKRK